MEIHYFFFPFHILSSIFLFSSNKIAEAEVDICKDTHGMDRKLCEQSQKAEKRTAEKEVYYNYNYFSNNYNW